MEQAEPNVISVQKTQTEEIEELKNRVTALENRGFLDLLDASYKHHMTIYELRKKQVEQIERNAEVKGKVNLMLEKIVEFTKNEDPSLRDDMVSVFANLKKSVETNTENNDVELVKINKEMAILKHVLNNMATFVGSQNDN